MANYGIGQQILDALQGRGGTMKVTPEESPVLQALRESKQTFITDPINRANQMWENAPINRPLAAQVPVPIVTPSAVPKTAWTDLSGERAWMPKKEVEFQSGPAAEARREAAKPLHERYASPREALNNMPDAEYKTFADANKHVPGLGYVIDKKSGKLQRIIPASRRQPELPEMNAEQLHAVAGLLGAINQGRSTAATEARLGIEGRRADITENRYAEQTDIERQKLAFEVDKLNKGSSLKDPMNFVKALDMFSPDEVDEYGMKTGKKNYMAGAEVLGAAGYPVPKGMKMPEQKPIIAPKKGDVIKGYRFKGGNPADKNSWEKS